MRLRLATVSISITTVIQIRSCFVSRRRPVRLRLAPGSFLITILIQSMPLFVPRRRPEWPRFAPVSLITCLIKLLSCVVTRRRLVRLRATGGDIEPATLTKFVYPEGDNADSDIVDNRRNSHTRGGDIESRTSNTSHSTMMILARHRSSWLSSKVVASGTFAM